MKKGAGIGLGLMVINGFICAGIVNTAVDAHLFNVAVLAVLSFAAFTALFFLLGDDRVE